MVTVGSRDLRNHTADVLPQVSGGTRVTITVNGRPVAEIGPVPGARPQFFARADLIDLIAKRQADPGLTDALERLSGDTTDDVAAP
ncbi:MAG: type II toxin-antitoxin system prevent-host-death family antitoxin [Jatrophihabitans sp.]|nr:MAG: type II toxin-antitoxin system prevent-host-death family antitoxin [Jatrophihabitans sp.]